MTGISLILFLMPGRINHEDPGKTIYSFQIDRDEILYHTDGDVEYIKFLQERGRQSNE